MAVKQDKQRERLDGKRKEHHIVLVDDFGGEMKLQLSTLARHQADNKATLDRALVEMEQNEREHEQYLVSIGEDPEKHKVRKA